MDSLWVPAMLRMFGELPFVEGLMSCGVMYLYMENVPAALMLTSMGSDLIQRDWTAPRIKKIETRLVYGEVLRQAGNLVEAEKTLREVAPVYRLMEVTPHSAAFALFAQVLIDLGKLEVGDLVFVVLDSVRGRSSAA